MATAGLSKNNLNGLKYHATSMHCSRCKGLMVTEQGFNPMRGSSESEVSLQRCVQCGEVLDPVILQNRQLRLGADLGRTCEGRPL